VKTNFCVVVVVDVVRSARAPAGGLGDDDWGRGEAVGGRHRGPGREIGRNIFNLASFPAGRKSYSLHFQPLEFTHSHIEPTAANSNKCYPSSDWCGVLLLLPLTPVVASVFATAHSHQSVSTSGDWNNCGSRTRRLGRRECLLSTTAAAHRLMKTDTRRRLMR